MITQSNRLNRERRTLQAMIGIYCRGNHHPAGALCVDCQQLSNYALQRVDKCPWKAEKPTCAKCSIQCYKPVMREQVRQVMRYSGPRMVLHHPLLALLHFWDGWTVKQKQN